MKKFIIIGCGLLVLCAVCAVAAAAAAGFLAYTAVNETVGAASTTLAQICDDVAVGDINSARAAMSRGLNENLSLDSDIETIFANCEGFEFGGDFYTSLTDAGQFDFFEGTLTSVGGDRVPGVIIMTYENDDYVLDSVYPNQTLAEVKSDLGFEEDF